MTRSWFPQAESVPSDPYPQLRRFVLESNRIEGIHREPTGAEIAATGRFVELGCVTGTDLVKLVAVFQPDAVLRDNPGLDVGVGSHVAPPGGPGIPRELDRVLAMANRGRHPYLVHHAYEELHPFTDGNGRSGRALWMWGMRRRAEREWQQALALGFLHQWYYQSLEHGQGVEW
jgi:hypothetical protein